MAIIGAISINMGVNTGPLQKGLLGSAGLINQFGASMKLAGSGLGMLAKDSMKFVKGVGQDIASMLPIKTFGKAAGIAGGAITALGRGSLNVFQDIGGMARVAATHINKFGSDAYRAGKQLGLALAGGGILAAAGIYKAVKAGSDMVETQNLIKQQFGESSEVVISQSKLMARAWGLSQQKFQQSAGMLGGIFENVGYAQKDLAGLSTEVVKLAADVSRYKNLKFDVALEKVSAGITGQAKGLKMIGINIQDEVITQEAYRLGIAKVGEELTEQQKVQARLASLVRQTAHAHGDLARTGDEVAGAMESVQGRFENFVALLGEQLQPIAKTVLAEMSTGIEVISASWAGSGKAALNATDATIIGAEQQSQSIGFIQQSVGSIGDAWQSVSKAFLAVQIKITEGLIFMVENLDGFATGIGKIVSYFTGVEMSANDFTQSWMTNLKALEAQQLETFSTKDSAKPFSQTINKAFDDARKKTLELRAELAKSTFDITKAVPKGQALKKAVKAEKQENVAAGFGSAEATNMILKSQFGGDQTAKDNARIAKNTETANTHLATMSKGISKLASMGGGAANWEKL